MTKQGFKYGYGLTEREEQVLDLYDAGVAARDIAARINMREANVRTIISRFIGDDRRVREAAIRDATRQLGEACAALRERRAS